MVRLRTLDPPIGVRVPASQPKISAEWAAKMAAHFSCCTIALPLRLGLSSNLAHRPTGKC